jgi:hypothetical protein
MKNSMLGAQLQFEQAEESPGWTQMNWDHPVGGMYRKRRKGSEQCWRPVYSIKNTCTNTSGEILISDEKH